jgi:hypothetical protein
MADTITIFPIFSIWINASFIKKCPYINCSKCFNFNLTKKVFAKLKNIPINQKYLSTICFFPPKLSYVISDQFWGGVIDISYNNARNSFDMIFSVDAHANFGTAYIDLNSDQFIKDR